MARAVPSLPQAAVLTNDEKLCHLFSSIQQLLRLRQAPIFISHIGAHTKLPGSLSRGSDLVDMITHAYVIDVTNKQLAIRSHAKFHQNASALRRQFRITREEACQIVKSCPACPVHFSLPTYLVNPRGFMPDHLQQMDVTLFPTFGPLK